MMKAIENLSKTFDHAMKVRPKVGGFPVLAETLRLAGVTKNIWQLPSCQSMYLTNLGPVMVQGTPLTTGMMEIPKFDQDLLIQALRRDQAGESSFPEFLASAWRAGCVSYEVDFEKRQVIYFGCYGEEYLEEYPAVMVSMDMDQ